jgi:hypothetical protein
LADLFVELVLCGIGLLAHLFATVAEDIRQAGQRLLLPSADLRRVHGEDLRDLGGCLMRLDGLHCDLGLQAGRVILTRSWHCLSSIFNAVDYLRKGFFRVQILGSITDFGGDVSYYTNWLDFNARHNKIGPNFNPEAGFIERTDAKQDWADLTLKLRPKISKVRELNFEGFFYNAPDTHGVVQTQEWQATFAPYFTMALTPTTTCTTSSLSNK